MKCLYEVLASLSTARRITCTPRLVCSPFNYKKVVSLFQRLRCLFTYFIYYDIFITLTVISVKSLSLSKSGYLIIFNCPSSSFYVFFKMLSRIFLFSISPRKEFCFIPSTIARGSFNLLKSFKDMSDAICKY